MLRRLIGCPLMQYNTYTALHACTAYTLSWQIHVHLAYQFLKFEVVSDPKKDFPYIWSLRIGEFLLTCGQSYCLTCEVCLIPSIPSISTAILEITFHPHHVFPSLIRVTYVDSQVIKQFFESHFD